MIENTTQKSQEPEETLGYLAASLSPGGSDQYIADQERAGQAQLVASDRLPVVRDNQRADFEKLGFTFGDPDPQDPLFAPATLPEGWTREASDHPMWSYLVDQLGRRRVGVCYKAAFYDRQADMSLHTVYTHVWHHIHEGRSLISDDTWATPAAIAEECRRGMREAQDHIDTWTAHGHAEYVEQYIAERDKFAAVLAKFDTTEEQP
ncbi:hypothetical protein ACWF94_36930 [Streptomyces sp. NPDC055078]